MLVLEADGIVHGREVVQNQELLQIRHQLHQRLTSTYLERHHTQTDLTNIIVAQIK